MAQIARLANLALIAALCACSVEHKPGQKLDWTSTYDSGARRLTVSCTSASGGKCHLLIDSGGERRAATVPQGSGQTFDNIDEAARICVTASADDVQSCSWSQV